jgi:hypothetical protein
MRKTVLILMFGLAAAIVSCADEDSTSDVNNGNGDNGGGTPDSLRTITLDHVDGSPATGQITAGDSVVFYLRLKNAVADKAKGITNGFKIYSPDGATWGTVAGDFTGTLGKDDFDLVWKINTFDIDGAGEDTVAFSAVVMTGPGMPPGFDDIVYTITIGPISTLGKNVCVDSAYYPTAGTWMWAYGSEIGSFPPSWDGPHCFEVVE